MFNKPVLVLLAVAAIFALANAAATTTPAPAVKTTPAPAKATPAPKVTPPVQRPTSMNAILKGAPTSPFGKLAPPNAPCKNNTECASIACEGYDAVAKKPGKCGLLAGGQSCSADAQCMSATCKPTTFKCYCTLPVASNKYGICRQDSDCCAPSDPSKTPSLYCETSSNTCKPGFDPTKFKPTGAACKTSKECASNACEVDIKGLFSCGQGGADAACQNNTQCLSGKCVDAKCTAVGLGKKCRVPSDCAAPVISPALKNLQGTAATSAKTAAASANVPTKITCNPTSKVCQTNGCSKKNAGAICKGHAECCSGNCTTVAAGIMKCQPSAPGGDCDTSLDCVNGGCTAQGKCPLALKGQICHNDKQCDVITPKTNSICVIAAGKSYGACDYLGCGPLQTAFGKCAKDADCCSGICHATDKVCAPTGSGRACNTDGDCIVSFDGNGKALPLAISKGNCLLKTRLCACSQTGQTCYSDVACCNKNHKCRSTSSSGFITSVSKVKYTLGKCGP